MPNFMRGPLSKDQIDQITRDTGCKRRHAVSRAKAAIQHGIDLDYFMDQQLYRMGRNRLIYYLEQSKVRKYVETLEKSTDIPAYEIYRQMMKANYDYGISYLTFSRKKLLNASDEQLEEIKNIADKRNMKKYSKIAKALEISVDEAQQLVEHIKEVHEYGLNDIYENRLYLMDDAQIEEFKEEKHKYSETIIEKIQEKTGWSEAQIRKHMRHCSVDFGLVTDVYYCSGFYGFDDSQLALCGNSEDSKKLNAKYNKKLHYLSNKKLFDETYRQFLGRKFWVNRDTSFEEFEEFAEGLDEAFCKPFNSTNGRGAYKYPLKGIDLKEAYDYFMAQPEYLIEESLVQHPEMSKFYPDSINTIRLISILDNGKFDAFAGIARFGKEGVTDNFSSGGIACSIDTKTGIIMTDGLTKTGDVYETHPVTGEKFKEFQIPHWDQALKTAEAILNHVDTINYAGLDLAITEDGVVIIEGNASPSFSGLQATALLRDHYLKPLYFKYIYGEDADEILENAVEVIGISDCNLDQAINRLMEAKKYNFDYDFVKQGELYRMTEEQIRSVGSDSQLFALVEERSKNDGSAFADAFFQISNANEALDNASDAAIETA